MDWGVLIILATGIVFFIYNDKKGKRGRQEQTQMAVHLFWSSWRDWKNTSDRAIPNHVTGGVIWGANFWQYVHYFMDRYSVPNKHEFIEVVRQSHEFAEVDPHERSL